jgi:hypothetical protein
MDSEGVARDFYTLTDSGVHQREGEVASIAALLSPSQVRGCMWSLKAPLYP